MGDVGDHFLAQLLVALERGRHRVKRSGQFHQLTRAVLLAHPDTGRPRFEGTSCL